MRVTKEEKILLFKRLMQDSSDYGQYYWAHAAIELTRKDKPKHLKDIIRAYKLFLATWEED